MTIIKSIDIISWAKIQALFGIIIALVYGILLAIVGTAYGMRHGLFGLEALGLVSIILFPIIFAIMGFICGAIMAFLNNIFADKIGGIVVTLADK